MKAGRIDYSPDYKSEKPDAFDDDRLMFCNSEPREKLQAECTRLRDAVVEAAKTWRTERGRISATTYPATESLRLSGEADLALYRVIDALTEFEHNQK